MQELEAEVQEAKDLSAAYYEKLRQGAEYVQYLQQQAEVSVANPCSVVDSVVTNGA